MSTPPPSRTFQRQHRLPAEHVEELVADYASGASIMELAKRYEINRTTVMKHLDRSGVDRRFRKLSEMDVLEAARLYDSGLSLAAVGKHLGVYPSTIYSALRKAGVQLRDQHGREVG